MRENFCQTFIVADEKLKRKGLIWLKFYKKIKKRCILRTILFLSSSIGKTILPQVLIKPNKSGITALNSKEMASFHHRRETRGSTLLSRARDRGQKLLSRCIYIDRIDRLNYSQQRIISRGRTFVRREISDNYAIPGAWKSQRTIYTTSRSAIPPSIRITSQARHKNDNWRMSTAQIHHVPLNSG